MLSSRGLSSNGNAASDRLKSYDDKINELKTLKDPFKFPMPLGQPSGDGEKTIHSKLETHNQPDHKTPSSTHKSTIQSTFKAMLLADKKTIKNVLLNASTASSYFKSTKSANSTKSAHTSRNISAANENGTKIYNLNISGRIIPIKYVLRGQPNEVLNMTLKDKNNSTLLVHLLAGSTGMLQVELARTVIDSKRQNMHTDKPFAVFEDGVYTPTYETRNGNDVRQLVIEFHKGISEIAIIGTHSTPEYGAAATIIHGISMTVIIIGILICKHKSFRLIRFGSD
jgi:hypothetical protein